jgi:hypothetical protein
MSTEYLPQIGGIPGSERVDILVFSLYTALNSEMRLQDVVYVCDVLFQPARPCAARPLVWIGEWERTPGTKISQPSRPFGGWFLYRE